MLTAVINNKYLNKYVYKAISYPGLYPPSDYFRPAMSYRLIAFPNSALRKQNPSATF